MTMMMVDDDDDDDDGESLPDLLGEKLYSDDSDCDDVSDDGEEEDVFQRHPSAACFAQRGRATEGLQHMV